MGFLIVTILNLKFIWDSKDILTIITISERKKEKRKENRENRRKIIKEIIQENFKEPKDKCTQQRRWKKTHVIAQYHKILEHERWAKDPKSVKGKEKKNT